MSHKNYGGTNHSNTGYNNHTNAYNNHTNSYSNHSNYYSNHTNTYSQVSESYANYTQRAYGQANYTEKSSYDDYSDSYSDYRVDLVSDVYDEVEKLEEDFLHKENRDISLFYSQTSGSWYVNKGLYPNKYGSSYVGGYLNIGGPGYKNYFQFHSNKSSYTNTYMNWANYLNHTQATYTQSSYSQSGYNNGGGSGYKQTVNSNYNNASKPNYQQYSQSGSGTANYLQYSQSGYTNHGNTGYTDHVNVNNNIAPVLSSTFSTFGAFLSNSILEVEIEGIEDKCSVEYRFRKPSCEDEEVGILKEEYTGDIFELNLKEFKSGFLKLLFITKNEVFETKEFRILNIKNSEEPKKIRTNILETENKNIKLINKSKNKPVLYSEAIEALKRKIMKK